MKNQMIESYIKISKYCYNRIDYDKFAEIYKELGIDGESYLQEKWEKFMYDINGFMLSNTSFLEKVVEKIIEENYNG